MQDRVLPVWVVTRSSHLSRTIGHCKFCKFSGDIYAHWRTCRNPSWRDTRRHDARNGQKLKAQGHTLHVQSGAGLAASVTDAAYEAVGVDITDAAGALSCELVLKVSAPTAAELKHMKSGAALVGMLNPFDAEGLSQLAVAGLTSFALEAAPRTTRAQSMDVLSSQANIAGYKAVMVASDKYQRFFPCS